MALMLNKQNLASTALTSDGLLWQPANSQNCLFGRFVITFSDASSLVGGLVLVEELQVSGATAVASTWRGIPQEISVVASGGGTPNVINANTATATAVVGGVVRNTTGVTTITNTATIIIAVNLTGQPVRLSFDLTSGTVNVAAAFNGVMV